jgi:hypothetical protein
VSADEIFAPILGERATGVDLELLLLGLSGLGSRWPPPPWTSAPDGKGLGFQATFPGGSMEEARIEGDPPLMTRLARRTAGGKVLFRARFERYREVAHTRVVGRVEVEAPAKGNTLRVDWEQVARDGVSPADLAWPEESSVQ